MKISRWIGKDSTGRPLVLLTSIVRDDFSYDHFTSVEARLVADLFRNLYKIEVFDLEHQITSDPLGAVRGT